MPRLIVVEGGEGQRRKLDEQLAALSAHGYALTGRTEAATVSGGWPAVLASSRSGGLFEEKRLQVIESAEQLGPFPETLADFLDSEEADNVIVAAFNSDSKKIFPKTTLKKIVFVRADASVPPWKRREWLMGLARDKGFKLDGAAASLLVESIESQEELRSELNKLAVCSGGAVTVDVVKALSFDEGGNVLLRFLDGVCQARPRDVLYCLQHMESDPSPLPLISALYNRLRPVLYMCSFKGEKGGRALAALGLNREYALRMAHSALDNYGAEALLNFLLRLIRLSYVEKTTFAEGWFGFENALWSLMGAKK